MYVISLRITAVFRNPLSATRKPLVVSFSSLSPGANGAFITLKEVAEILLSTILLHRKRLPLVPGRSQTLRDLRDVINLPSSIVAHSQTVGGRVGVCRSSHNCVYSSWIAASGSNEWLGRSKGPFGALYVFIFWIVRRHSVPLGSFWCRRGLPDDHVIRPGFLKSHACCFCSGILRYLQIFLADDFVCGRFWKSYNLSNHTIRRSLFLCIICMINLVRRYPEFCCSWIAAYM